MNVLYITYKGLGTNLGQSQILPYLRGLTNKGVSFTVIDLEGNLSEREAYGNINTISITSSIKNKALNGVSRIIKGYYVALLLSTRNKYDLVHCRNVFAAEIALALRFWFGTPFLFDMRGFWGDLRRENGAWPQQRWWGRRLYSLWKWRERSYIRKAAFINVLSHKAKDIVRENFGRSIDSVVVNPCSVDFNEAINRITKSRAEVRELLGVDDNEFLCLYLGSSGGVYDDKVMLDTFKSIKGNHEKSKLLCIGNRNADKWISAANEFGIEVNNKDIIATSCDHTDVFNYINASDVGLSFCKDWFFSNGVSSTKITEYLSLGTPVITNFPTGDSGYYSDNIFGYFCIENKDIKDIIQFALNNNDASRNRIRREAAKYFDINRSISSYLHAYTTIQDSRRQ